MSMHDAGAGTLRKRVRLRVQTDVVTGDAPAATSARRRQTDTLGPRMVALKKLRGDLPLPLVYGPNALLRAKLRAVAAIADADLRRMARKAESVQRVAAVEAAAKRLDALNASPPSAPTPQDDDQQARAIARTIPNAALPRKCLEALEAWRKVSMERLPTAVVQDSTRDGKYATSEKHLAEIDWERCGAKPTLATYHNFLQANGKRNVALDDALLREVGVLRTPLKAIYAPDHYLGWHDNRDLPGWNILFCWSDDAAKGYWRHVDPDTGRIVTVRDTPGWSVKANFYGRDEGQRLKHCAAANGSWRCTLAYVVESKAMWADIVDEFGA